MQFAQGGGEDLRGCGVPLSVWRVAHPDHDTLSEFRKRHLEALAGLFTQALLLCQKAGLVKLGHVAIDGTKIRANAGVERRGPHGQVLVRGVERRGPHGQVLVRGVERRQA